MNLNINGRLIQIWSHNSKFYIPSHLIANPVTENGHLKVYMKQYFEVLRTLKTTAKQAKQ
jgi:hypothetical protein